jgi:hypothetical protein
MAFIDQLKKIVVKNNSIRIQFLVNLFGDRVSNHYTAFDVKLTKEKNEIIQLEAATSSIDSAFLGMKFLGLEKDNGQPFFDNFYVANDSSGNEMPQKDPSSCSMFAFDYICQIFRMDGSSGNPDIFELFDTLTNKVERGRRGRRTKSIRTKRIRKPSY